MSRYCFAESKTNNNHSRHCTGGDEVPSTKTSMGAAMFWVAFMMWQCASLLFLAFFFKRTPDINDITIGVAAIILLASTMFGYTFCYAVDRLTQK
jgi:hypothetical protein